MSNIEIGRIEFELTDARPEAQNTFAKIRSAKPVIATVVTCREFFQGQSHIDTRGNGKTHCRARQERQRAFHSTDTIHLDTRERRTTPFQLSEMMQRGRR